MPTVAFTANLRALVDCPTRTVDGQTVRAALEAVFAEFPRLRGYVVDERGVLREHMVVFLDGVPINDRNSQSDATTPTSMIYVMQALSGG